MVRLLLRESASRIFLAIPILLAVTLFSFVLLFKIGDPAAVIAGEMATQDQIDAVRTNLGLDRPILGQYVDWLTAALGGDFGSSLHNKGTTAALLMERTPPTLQIVIGSMVVSIIISLGMGVLAGLRPGGWIDRTFQWIAILGLAIPNFLLGLVLMLVFAVRLKILPAGGYYTWTESGVDSLRYLVLPVVALAVALVCQQVRTFRASLLKEYEEDYVRSARMKNLSETEIFFKHILRNASAPVVTVIGIEVGALITGSILVEAVFGIPGIGSLMVESVNLQDFAVVQALILLAAVVVIAANLVADIVALWLNPAARSGRA